MCTPPLNTIADLPERVVLTAASVCRVHQRIRGASLHGTANLTWLFAGVSYILYPITHACPPMPMCTVRVMYAGAQVLRIHAREQQRP